ncbi:MAG: monovalent cation/H+ antiporter complex subunit F [Pirellulaceae bacterium]
MMAELNIVTPTAHAIVVVLVVAIVLAFVRLVFGPSLPDRVVALDLITVLLVGLIAVYAVATDEPNLLGVAMVVALITFIGTIAFAYYLQRRGQE